MGRHIMPDEDIRSVLDMPTHKCLTCLLPGAAAVKQKNLPDLGLRQQQAHSCIGAGHAEAPCTGTCQLRAANCQPQHIYQSYSD